MEYTWDYYPNVKWYLVFYQQCGFPSKRLLLLETGELVWSYKLPVNKNSSNKPIKSCTPGAKEGMEYYKQYEQGYVGSAPKEGIKHMHDRWREEGFDSDGNPIKEKA